jgi:hypothetical protein
MVMTPTGDVVYFPGGAMDVVATARNMVAGYMADGVESLREYGGPSYCEEADRYGYLIVEGDGQTLYLRPQSGRV